MINQQSYFPTNFMMTGNPIATLPLNPNSANYTTTVGMQSLLQSLYSSTATFEAAAYNPYQNNSPYSSGFDAPASYQPQFPSYSPFGLNSDPYFSSFGQGGQGGQSGFGQMGQTNPYFNAGFTGAMSGFFGNNNNNNQMNFNPYQSFEPQSSNGCPAQSSNSCGAPQSNNGCPSNSGGQGGVQHPSNPAHPTGGTGSTHHHHHHHHQSSGGSSNGCGSH